jgi:hypothetical protein
VRWQLVLRVRLLQIEPCLPLLWQLRLRLE